MSGRSQAIIGKGTTFGWGAPVVGSGGAVSAPTAFTKFAEVFDATTPEPETKEVNVTHYESPNGWLEFISGWTDGKEVPFKLNYRADSQAVLQAQQGVSNYFQVTMPPSQAQTAGDTFVFPGFIKSIKNKIPNEDKVTSDVTIRVSGKPTFTAGT